MYVFLVFKYLYVFTHGKESLNIEAAVFSIKIRVNIYLSASFKFRIIGEEDESNWKVPEAPAIKINCDGSWYSVSKRAGFGCISRDSMGCVIGARAGSIDVISSSMEVEGASIL